MNELNQRRLERQPLWREDPAGYERVLGVLFRHDPIRICFPDNPKRETEYLSEVNTILPRIRGVEAVAEVQQIIFEEFVRWFGRAAGRKADYQHIAEEIRHARQSESAEGA